MNEGDDFSDDARELLQVARKPRQWTDGERHRTAARVAPMALALGGSSLFSAKALAAALIVGTIASVSVAVVTHRTSDHGRRLDPTVRHVDAPARTRPAVSASVASVPVKHPDLMVALPAALEPSVSTCLQTRPEHHVRATPTSSAGTATARVPVAESMSSQPASSEPAPPALREDQCLSQAQAVLQTTPSEALSQVTQCERLFPHGNMVAEREMLAIEALSGLGRRDDARTRAEAFLASYPHSIYSERVEHLIGSLR